ncbi:invasin domain 3-containing protein [Providencia zhijiangensis]|uniref:Invasin domain 3-containing protein n=1 Tax=Providencia zhijiangensis TaxID=3053982 RepID=A0ABZ0N2K6_9GAMM|nr:invasin domain 3-containing protein [Providencia sp. D4759]WPA92617.1 invasin domain 3-containing protein [Providencia sp. D4759]
MSSTSLTVKKKLANGFVIFTAIWSSAIMPVIPSYAKMLDNNDLPSLASENNVTEDNTERLVAEYSKTLGSFLSQNKNEQNLSDKAQNYVRNKVASEATKEIENWLSKAGNARLNINIDKNFSIKNSQLDWLIPWYDHPKALLFTQHSIHRSDERLHTNNGIGLRHFDEKNTIGINAFIDHDISHAHTRAGLGVEYWQDYLKFNANGYLGLTSWKSAPELNHDYNAKPAHGWDVQIESWLPAYPQLGGNLKYEQYYGDSVALFGKNQRQKNPSAATIGAHWTPFPLFTLNANHKFGSKNRSETQAKLQFTWIFGKSLAHHLDPTKVAEARRLSGNRYDFVERNNSIILDYQKKTLLSLSLPTKIQGETGQSIPLVKSFTSQYPLKHIEWNAPELLAAGGSISSTDHTAVLILPSYKTAKTTQDAQKANRYRLRAIAYDVNGNTSPVAETLVEVTDSGVLSINPRDITFYGKGLANGNDINGLSVIVRDPHGNTAPNAKVVFVLPNTLALIAQKANTAARPDIQRDLRKKMQAMKVAKPVEYTTTTNAKGEAQVQFTSQIAGAYEITVYTGNHPPVKTQVTFIPDVAEAYVHNFTVSRPAVIADGISAHSVKALITDKNKNPIPNHEVNFSATNAKIVDKATTNENGLVEVTLTSVKAGASEVTLSINGHSETKVVEFISGKAYQIAILEIPEVYAGRESQVVFQIRDNQGNPIIDANNDATITIDQKVSSTPIWGIDVDNGTYAAKVYGLQSGEHTIQVAMDNIVSLERTFTTREAGTIQSSSTDGSGPDGALGVIASIDIDINPNRTNFKSGDNPLIIVTLKDSFGNAIENVDFNHLHLGNMKGKDLAWRDEGHSDYVVNLPLTTIGDLDITANINGIYSPKTVLTVYHNSGTSKIDHVALSVINPTLNAGDKPTLKVELTDGNGNTVTGVQQLDIIIDNQTHTLPVTQNPDGSYTVELPAQHSGSKNIQVTVNGKDSNQATITVQAPKPIPANTTGKAGEQGVLASVALSSGALTNLKSGDALALTVTVQDSFKNPLTGLASAIALTHAQTGTVTWKDNQDGTYTASLVLSKLGADTLTATVNTVSSQAITVNVTNLTGHTGVQNVVITPTNTTPNAGATLTLTVKLTDSNGNVVNDVKQLDVMIAGTKQPLSATQNPDGSYTVELPAQHSGSKNIQVTVNGKDSNQATITVQAPKPIPANTTGKAGEQGVLASVALSSGALTNLKSGDALALTVTVQDSFKNPLTGLASAIALTHAQTGTVTWKDNQDGTYTASLVLSKLGADTLTATINKVSSQAITVNVTNLTGHAGVQNVVITSTNNTPNAGEIPTLTVKLTDKNGNVVNDVKQLDVTIAGTKHTLPATQNADGSYTVELPAQHSGSKNIQVTVNGKDSNQATLTVQAPTPMPTNIHGNAGEQGVLATVELTTGSLADLKSGDTLALTVTVQDSFKNPLTGLASAIALTHAQTGTVTWKDNQDGTYTASLPLTKLGNDTLTATVNTVSSKAIAFNVVNLTGHTGVQNVVITPTNTTPNAGATLTLTVKLTDSNGNVVNDVKQLDVMIAGTKQPLSATQNPDGSYTVELPAQHSGSKNIQVTVNGKDSNQATITVQAPKPIPANTTGKAGEQGVLASVALSSGALTNLKSGDALALTVTAQDSFKNPLTGLASAIALTHAQTGTLTWKDNQDGTYTASLPLTKLGNDTLTATVNTVSSKAIAFNVVNLTGHTGVQNVVITPTNTTPNAGATLTLTVKLTDSNGNVVNDVKQLDVMIAGTKQPLSATQNPDGSYTVELPAQHSGSKNIQVTVNGKDSNQATITVQAPKPIPANTTGKAGEQGVLASVALSSGALTNLKSGDALALTVTAQDSFKNPLTGLASAIALTHAQTGTLTWKDNQDGTYTASLPLTKLGNDTLTATVNTVSSKAIAFNVVNLTGHTGVQNVVITPTNTTPNAGATLTLTVKLTDSNGNVVNDVKQLDVTIAGTKHTLPATQNADGSYTVELPAQHSGSKNIQVTVNGKDSNQATITVQAPKPIPANTTGNAGEQGVLATVELTTGSLADLKSGDTLALTVTAQDSFKNPLTGLASAITLAHQQTGTVTWKDNQNGTYTASLELSKLGSDTLTATVNAIASQPTSVTVEAQQGKASVTAVELHAQPTIITAGQSTTLTFTLRDKHNNGVVKIPSSDIKLEDNKLALSNIQWQEQGNGVYTTSIMFSEVRTHSLTASIGQFTETTNVIVNSPTGKDAVKTIAIAPIANSDAGQPSSISIDLTDQYKNLVKNVSSSDISMTINGQKQNILFIENSTSNKYTAQLPASKANRYKIVVEVNGQSETTEWVVNSPIAIPISSYTQDGLRGSLETISITHNAKNHTVNSGDKVTLSVELKDKFDNPLTGAAGSLKLLTNLHSASAWKELSSGLYTQDLTMDKLDKQSIAVMADKILSNKLELTVTPAKGANHIHKTTLETNVSTIEAGKEVILTLTLTDIVNNGVIDVDTKDIQLSNNGKPTVATWAHSQDGIYTTKIRLDTAGNYQFKALVNNQSTPIKAVDVTAPRGANVVNTAQMTANADAFNAGEKVELTLVLKDQYGNLVADVKGADIALKDSHSVETINSSKIVWQMTSTGVYKTALPLTKVGKHTLTATVNKKNADTNEITVKALKGTSHVKAIQLATTETSINAGESTSLTLTLLDSYGNEVSDVKPSDIKFKNTDNTITTTASWVKSPSHESVYTASVTLEKVKKHTLSVDVNSQTKNINIDVKPLEGAKHVARVELNMSAAARLGANTPLILQLKDKFGNEVKHVVSQDIQLTNNGQVENITWTENSQGQYTANWLSTKVGKHQLDVVVNGNRLPKSIDIELTAPKGAENVDSIKIDILDTSDAGDTVKLTLKLQDKYDFDVIDVNPSDITLSSDKQALSSLAWHDDKHGNYSTDIKFDKAGKHTLTVNISNSAKTTAKKEIIIKALPPVFGNGKSELSIDTDSVEGNGKDKATITLKLIDQNNTPISGINPTLTISNSAFGNTVMKETSASGIYTATISNSSEGKVIVTLDSNSIGYVGTKQEIDIYFYSFQNINYPLNSVTNQQFIKFGYQNDDYSDYTWENSYPDVIGINSTSSLYIKGKPKPQENVITLIARPKNNTHQLKAIRATITIDKFIYSSKDTTKNQHIVDQLCKNEGGRLATIDEVKGLYKTPSRKLNLLMNASIYAQRHWIDSNSGYIFDDKVNYPTPEVPADYSLPVVCTVDY